MRDIKDVKEFLYYNQEMAQKAHNAFMEIKIADP